MNLDTTYQQQTTNTTRAADARQQQQKYQQPTPMQYLLLRRRTRNLQHFFTICEAKMWYDFVIIVVGRPTADRDRRNESIQSVQKQTTDIGLDSTDLPNQELDQRTINNIFKVFVMGRRRLLLCSTRSHDWNNKYIGIWAYAIVCMCVFVLLGLCGVATFVYILGEQTCYTNTILRVFQTKRICIRVRCPIHTYAMWQLTDMLRHWRLILRHSHIENSKSR